MEAVSDAQLGAKLAEALPDKGKILLHTACRTALAIIISLAGSGGIRGMGKWFASFRGIAIFSVLWIAFLAVGLYPLVHFKDSLEFYENGISYKGRRYLLSQLGAISFRDYSYGLKTSCMMDTDARVFDVTFLERPKRAFNKAYMNRMPPAASQTTWRQ